MQTSRPRRWRFAQPCVPQMAVLLFLHGAVYAQAPRGTIRLQVTDPSGAVMQASGRLENLAGGVARDFQTDSQGAVKLENLPFGR